MTQARIDRAVEAMRANKLLFNKGISKVVEIGFGDNAHERVCKEILAEIEKILIHGINHGFNKVMKDCLLELTNIAAKTCSNGFMKTKIDVIYAKRNACLERLKMSEDTGCADLRKTVKEYIASTQDGIEIMKREGFIKNEAAVRNEEKCEKIIEDILLRLDTVMDYTSPAAVEKYNGIVKKLSEWRTSLAVSEGFFDNKTVSALQAIQAEVREWCGLYAAPKKRASADDIMPVVADDLTSLIESDNTRQSVQMFFDRCDDYVYEVYKMGGTAVAEKVRDLRYELAAAQNELRKLQNDRYHNRINDPDFEYYSGITQGNIDAILFDISRIQLGSVARSELQARRELISRIEQPIKSTYTRIQYNRLQLQKVFGDMDFARIVAMLNNNLNAREMETGINDIRNMLIARGFIDRSGNELMRELRDNFGAEYDSAWNK